MQRKWIGYLKSDSVRFDDSGGTGDFYSTGSYVCLCGSVFRIPRGCAKCMTLSITRYFIKTSSPHSTIRFSTLATASFSITGGNQLSFVSQPFSLETVHVTCMLASMFSVAVGFATPMDLDALSAASMPLMPVSPSDFLRRVGHSKMGLAEVCQDQQRRRPTLHFGPS
eukprot:SAG31_NODE_1240_length_9167_cov_4.729599_12_plen_168_part_00